MAKNKRKPIRRGSRFEKLNGWVPPEARDYGVRKETERILQDVPVFASAGMTIAGTGAGKIVRLDDLLFDFAGYWPLVRQLIGDCVSFGWSKAIMCTAAADAMIRGETEIWCGELCTEYLYGCSRVVAGRSRLRNSDGSVGAWMAATVGPTGQGVIFRQVYETTEGPLDLTKYSGQRAKSWGYRGLPLETLEPIGDEHPTLKPVLVTSYEDVRDSIANGYGVAVCSNIGFRDTRDSEGYLRRGPTWNHCMAYVGVDDTRRPGCVLDNGSWLDCFKGPNPQNVRTGCGFVDAADVDRMAQQGDTYAVPGFEGIQSRWRMWD